LKAALKRRLRNKEEGKANKRTDAREEKKKGRQEMPRAEEAAGANAALSVARKKKTS